MRRIPLLVLATLACSDPARPDREPEPLADVIVTPQVNVQLGDTPAGQEPGYIVTGEVTATQGGVRVPAVVDSVVIHYRIAAGPFIRHARRTVPFSDVLPFTATAGQTYDVWAVMYATGTGIDAKTVTGTDEWVASGIGTAAGGSVHGEP